MAIIDARALPENQQIETTIAIVGGGAAGITIARELAGSGVPVAILESGGMTYDAATQDLCDAEIVGANYFPPTATRVRYFGGSTNRWDGLCRPLDPIDLECRSEIADSGWPFSSAELDGYYRRAQILCELGPFDYEPESWRDGAIGPLPLTGDRVRSGVFQIGPPTRFASAYGDALKNSADVAVYLNANAVEIETQPTSHAATRLRLACLGGKRHWVSAKLFVLAAGGLENPRLLLNSDAVERYGVGNGNDLVGRYFMDHPKIWKGAQIAFADAFPELGFYDYHRVRGTKIQGVFVPTERTLREEGLANFTICLDRASLADHSRSAAALRRIRRRFRHGLKAGDLVQDLARVVSGSAGLVAAACRRATVHRPSTLRSTRYWCDCPPDRESRITLSNRRDALGQRRARVDWRLPRDFERNLRRAHELLAEALTQGRLGRLRINTAEDIGDPMSAVEDSFHHMGATRMHRDPRRGVLDVNCRVHGMSNLYIAGSSVFPTYGQANPTLTIVALAVRLADRLKQILATGADTQLVAASGRRAIEHA